MSTPAAPLTPRAPRAPPATPFEPEFTTALTLLFEETITFNRTLGLRITAIAAEHVTGSIAMRPDLIGHHGHQRLHGGIISATLDAMAGLAVMAAIGARHMDEPAGQTHAALQPPGHHRHVHRLPAPRYRRALHAVGSGAADRLANCIHADAIHGGGRYAVGDGCSDARVVKWGAAIPLSRSDEAGIQACANVVRAALMRPTPQAPSSSTKERGGGLAGGSSGTFGRATHTKPLTRRRARFAAYHPSVSRTL